MPKTNKIHAAGINNTILKANKPDGLNMALFGKTTQRWIIDPPAQGTVKASATIKQPVVLSNLESIMSVPIHRGLSENLID